MTVERIMKLKSSTLPYLKLYYMELLCATLISSFAYLFYQLIPLHIFIAGILFAGSVWLLVKAKWDSVVREGILRKLPKVIRVVLLERSLLDLWNNLVYFPTITKIIGAFARAAVVKPPPEKMHQEFKHLSPAIQNALTTKGLLHLAPSRIQKLCLQAVEFPEDLPQDYGKNIVEWCNRQLYQKSQVKVHEESVGKLILARIDSKVRWHHLAIIACILAIGMRKMQVKKVRKMMLHSGVFIGVTMFAIMLLIKFKESVRKQALAKEDAKME